MARRVSLAASRLLVVAIAFLAASSLHAQSITSAGIAQIQALIADKQTRTAEELKVDSNLLFAARAASQERLGIQVVQPTYVRDFMVEEVAPDGSVQLNIRGSVSDGLLRALEVIGAQDVNSFPQFDTVTLRLPILKVMEIAALPDVRFVAPLEKGQTNKYVNGDAASTSSSEAGFVKPNVGSVTSQGVAAHAADLAQSTGINGAGPLVCVLSDGINSVAARQVTGDLPTPIFVLPGQAGAGDEGTAMLEIVHDIAPGASLGFATGFTGEAQMATNIQNLRSVLGCSIIVDDVSYFSESAFQDGPVAQAINTVTSDGALYFSSAANSGNLTHSTSGTWEGDWADSGFTVGGFPIQRFGTNPYNPITSANGDRLTLKWSDPLGRIEQRLRSLSIRFHGHGYPEAID